jgi:hypothetical protein
MTIANTTKTVGLALALVFLAATALAQASGSSSGVPRGSVDRSTGPTFPSTAGSEPTTGPFNPALSPPIAAGPADPSPPTVDPNAPNLAIQRGGAGSSPMTR